MRLVGPARGSLPHPRIRPRRPRRDAPLRRQPDPQYPRLRSDHAGPRRRGHAGDRAAKRLLEPIGAVHALNYSVTFEGAIALLQGEAKAARARFEGTLEAVIAGGHRYTTSSAIVAAHLAEALYELSDIDAAETLLIDYLLVIHDGCLPDHIIVAYRVLARIQAQRGQYAKALVTLDTLQDLGDVRSIPRISAASRIDKHRLALLAGDLAAARRMAPLLADASVWQSSSGFLLYAENLDDPLVADARLALAEGSVRAVIPRLQDAICEPTP